MSGFSAPSSSHSADTLHFVVTRPTFRIADSLVCLPFQLTAILCALLAPWLDWDRWEKDLGAFRLPEMVFGNSWFELEHIASGAKISFNAFDALKQWRAEKLPPVKVPAAAAWAERKYARLHADAVCCRGTEVRERETRGCT